MIDELFPDARPAEPVIEPGPVLAATHWATNADLIIDCVRLGYLRDDWITLDATYGLGAWWRKWWPKKLITSDLFTSAGVRSDFRRLPFADGTFQAITYDPPYVCIGARRETPRVSATSKVMAEMYEAYGLQDTPRTPAGLQDMIDDGLAEMHRVLAPGGWTLVKCQDYITSGRLWPGTHYTLEAALGAGYELVDRMEHVAARPRPQPAGRKQIHARRNLSTLFVLRKSR